MPDQTQLKTPYLSIAMIICNEFCERFCFYGMRTILSMYLVQVLMFNENQSKILFHSFVMLVYFFPLMGGILADSYLGKFRTILYLSLVYAVGNFMLAGASGLNNLDLNMIMTMAGLLMIAMGSGGIKPCVSAFGGDQFVMPQQESLLKKFFSMFYFSINAGSLISMWLTPLLVNDIKCLGHDTCYPVAFGVPGILMVAAIIFFYVGKRGYIYKDSKSDDKKTVDVLSCIWDATKATFKSHPETEKPKSDGFIARLPDSKYSPLFKNDVRIFLRILLIFVPVPLFWALYDQQGSSWTFQANAMDRKIWWNIEILPEQMQIINPLLIIIFIPICEVFIYPLCAKINFLKNPLEKMFVGSVLTTLAFLASSIVFYYLENGVKLHVFWLIPQYFLLTMGEILFSITGLEFCYNEAPDSLKSLIQALWLLTTALGDFFVVLISKFCDFDSQTKDSVFYTVLMLFDIIIFGFLAQRYNKFRKNLNKKSSDLTGRVNNGFGNCESVTVIESIQMTQTKIVCECEKKSCHQTETILEENETN